jgi:hypothetical protein
MLLESSDITFAEFRKQLDARMKELTSEGKYQVQTHHLEA